MSETTNKPKDLKIFSPATKEVKDYGLGEITNVSINGNAVIPILADRIYKSPYSAIRELYANEVTAVKKALRINPNLNPEIHISIDTNTRELIIKGVDSLGIDTDTFKYILAVMGNSGNNNENETGYYGLGFFSFVKMSERIKINSYSLESGEKWACIAKSALKFEQLKPENFKSLNKTGFEVTLTIKNELEIDRIIEKVREISKLSGVKTVLTVDDVINRLEQYEDLEKYFKSKYSEYFDNTAKYSLMYEHINNDDYELIIGYVTREAEPLREAFLINVPIRIDFPRYDFPKIALLNVKNERTFKPSADRERFAEKDEELLLEKIKSHVFDINDNLKQIETIQEWYDSPNKYFYEYIGNNNSFPLRTYVKTGKKHDMWTNGVKKEYLKDVLPIKKPDEFRISRTLRKKVFEKYENENIFAVKVDDIYNYDDFIEIGFVDIDYGKKKKSGNGNYNPNRLTKRFKFHSKYNSFDTLPNDAIAVIRVDDVRTTNLRYKLHTDKVYWIPQRADFNNDLEIEIDDLKDLLNMTKIYATNKGFLTTKHILELSNRFEVYELTNSIDGDDNKDRYMSKLYNYEPNYLLVKFDYSHYSDSDLEADLLKSVLVLNGKYINRDYVDFNRIHRLEQIEKFDTYKQKITDKRLIWIMDKMSTRWDDYEEQRYILSLQKSLELIGRDNK